MIHPPKIIGHNEQLKILNESYHVQFPHAWIFNGIKGIGKYSTAVSFIRSVCKIKGSNTQNFFEEVTKFASENDAFNRACEIIPWLNKNR